MRERRAEERRACNDLSVLLSSAPRGFASRSRVLARLASLVKIGELARRLRPMVLHPNLKGRDQTFKLVLKVREINKYVHRLCNKVVSLTYQSGFLSPRIK